MAGQESDRKLTLKLTQGELDEGLCDFDGKSYAINGKDLTLRRSLFQSLEILAPEKDKTPDGEVLYKCHELMDKVMSKAESVELTVDDIALLKERLILYVKAMPLFGTRVYGLIRDIIDPPKKG